MRKKIKPLWIAKFKDIFKTYSWGNTEARNEKQELKKPDDRFSHSNKYLTKDFVAVTILRVDDFISSESVFNFATNNPSKKNFLRHGSISIDISKSIILPILNKSWYLFKIPPLWAKHRF